MHQKLIDRKAFSPRFQSFCMRRGGVGSMAVVLGLYLYSGLIR